MHATASREVVLADDVAEFLKRSNANAEFESTYQIARECFPDLIAVEAYLQADPDEADRQRVVLHVTLPRSHSLQLVQDQRRRFYEEVVKRLPPAEFPEPVCRLSLAFARE